MTYIDGILVPVKPGRKADYLEIARRVDPLFIEYGALRVVEGWNDDVQPGKTNDLRTAVLAEEGEDIVFSWIEWPDKATRDSGWQKLMADERMAHAPEDNPMVGPRMIYGGFTVILDERK
ncbi:MULTISPECIES: DUF1428 domain-containing protein [unclassified Sphingobium]|uniref:DUF1428 domain-containing protein n=1 Tax=unclassified Sphingobium TaxID=2611147 RepID=UPI00222557E0|nr:MULTISPECIES: DUF1428 domain-containing protein [unclassified Sphingobium]MCW2396103.1 uncharacterized protein YbaA (DUF1428 family) [Sphingobium sp. B8D3B]MCW2419619.1 uncharacterized protein YbaA (DUF1428 family) [Sphingobium sp. B8D3C]